MSPSFEPAGAVATTPGTGAPDLDGMGLLVPALQSEPLPIRRIGPAPCTEACPAGINVKAYVSLIAERRFAQAQEVIRQRCPLPGICGRVCHHPCEAACQRGRYDDPIAIRALKRFAADLELENPRPSPKSAPHRPSKVAVIGSGPAGLTAAYDLSLAGYPVTVFEAETEPGGMLRFGITAFRLPRDVLDAEIEAMVRNGVEIRTGCRLGKNLELEGLLREGFGAVLLAVGAQKGRRLGVPGEEERPEVEDALAFLRRVNGGDRTPLKGRVVVIGGGSTAVEAARTALRLGADSVEILYRRSNAELLAGKEEIEATAAEGIPIRFLVMPSRVVSEDGRMKGLECLKVGLGEPDSSGRRRPIVIPGSEFLVEADRVFAAVGQEGDFGFVPPPATDHLVERGRLRVESDTFMTEMAGVFAAGDVVTGPATVIEAVAAGHGAAQSIRRYLEEGRPGTLEEPPERKPSAEYELPEAPPVEDRRRHPPMAPLRQGEEFAEVDLAFTPEDAVAEARRCLRCGPCGDCLICAPSCRRRHAMVGFSNGDGRPFKATASVRTSIDLASALDSDLPASGRLLPPNGDALQADPIELFPARVRIHEELCQGCGECVEVCPFQAITLSGGGDSIAKACLEEALCRGCNLCTAVCFTHAVVSASLSAKWWRTRLEDIFRDDSSPHVVLACERRSGAMETALEQDGICAEVVRFRCVGQVHTGMLLELYWRGASGILVAGCESARCRFASGATLASEEVDRARRMLRLLGGDEGRIACDWSEGRETDRLETPLKRFVGAAPCGAG